MKAFFKKIIISQIFLITFFILFSLFFKNPLYAFNEEFNSAALDTSIWKSFPNAGSVDLESGKIKLSSELTATFPFIYSVIDPFSSTNGFNIKIRMKYNRVTTKGSGINISTEIPSNGSADTLLSDPAFSKRYFLGIWQDSVGKFYVQYSGDCYNYDCSTAKIRVWEKGNIDLDYHTFDFRYLNRKYFVYLDGAEVFSSDPIDVRPNSIWFGNPSVQGPSNRWTNFEIDYIQISSYPSPLIILPGMTACWNGSLVKESLDDTNWILPIFSKIYYQNLFDSLNHAGLQENQDWYLFCYDWRKPLADNAEKLKEFINSNFDPSSKVNLVGHSMGGLISRTFTQSFPERVNKAIFLGGPSQGAVRSYPLWEAGQPWEYEGISKLIFETFLRANRQNGEHPMKTVRRVVPSVKDLLPTFDFLKDPSGTNFKNIETHKQKNNTLIDLNQTLTEPTKSLMNIIYGNNQSTLEAIKITSINVPPANWVHQTLGLWEDGEPIHTCPAPLCEYTDHNKDYSLSMIFSNEGDKTVLVKSSQIAGVDSYEVPDEHRDLANSSNSIQRIFNLLGISGSPSFSFHPIQKVIAFLIRSPAKITLIAPDGKEAGHLASANQIEDNFYDEEAQFLLVPNPLPGDYQVKISGTGRGEYGLLIGQLDENDDVSFTEYQFPTNEGKIDTFVFNANDETPLLEDTDGLLALRSAKSIIESLQEDRQLICPFTVQLALLNKSEKLIQKGNYHPASLMIKTALRFLNLCYLTPLKDSHLDSWEDYEFASTHLFNAYSILADKAHLRFQSSKIKETLTLQEKKFQSINDRLQKKQDKGREAPLIIVNLFEKTAELLQGAREALDQDNLSRAYILQFQVDLILPRLK